MDVAELKQKLSRLSPGWVGAIGGAMVAGAALVPGHRLLAGAAFGAAALALALRLTPCCDGCAAGAGCAGADVASPGAGTTADPAAPPPSSGAGGIPNRSPGLGTPFIVAAPSSRDISPTEDPGALLARFARARECGGGGCS